MKTFLLQIETSFYVFTIVCVFTSGPKKQTILEKTKLITKEKMLIIWMRKKCTEINITIL